MAKRKSMMDRNHDVVADGMKRRTRAGEKPHQINNNEPLDRKIQIMLPESMYQQLRKASFEQEVPFSAMIREAVQKHLD